MGAFEYQKSRHVLADAVFTFAKVAPTTAEPVTRTLTVVVGDDQVTVGFADDDFDLFKAIVREY